MADEEKEEKKSSGGLLPIINTVLLILVLGVGGFIAWTQMQNNQPTVSTDTAPTETPETKLPEVPVEDPNAVPVEMEIDGLTINLADDNRFLRTKILLILRTEEDKTRLNSTIGLASVKDMIITIISGKKFEDIKTPAGKVGLKEELVFRINKEFSPYKPVKKMFFTDFVSQ
ncbi:MAG: flagellar basal body-associated FliL family protein [Mariprofundaceae bacterium]|nr:flagellar basal body-associated FliL family protein [Mariprofundaceae bacterium]